VILLNDILFSCTFLSGVELFVLLMRNIQECLLTFFIVWLIYEGIVKIIYWYIL